MSSQLNSIGIVFLAAWKCLPGDYLGNAYQEVAFLLVSKQPCSSIKLSQLTHTVNNPITQYSPTVTIPITSSSVVFRSYYRSAPCSSLLALPLVDLKAVEEQTQIAPLYRQHIQAPTYEMFFLKQCHLVDQLWVY